jgi:membrane protease YdiL (CAAX protease family)
VLSLVFNLIYQTSSSVGRIEWRIAAHLVNLGLLIGIVLFAEKCPLSSIGLGSLRWWTLPLGLVAGALISPAFPLIHMLMSRLAIGSNEAATAFLFSLPFFVRFILVITAGIFEETLFRGYAIERLTSILGNKWVAGLISVTLFTLAHFSFWGLPT